MPKFRIITSNVVATEYLVTAKTAEEAEEMFAEGTFESSKDLVDYELDSNEEVIEPAKIAECMKCGKKLEWSDEGMCPDSDLHRISE